MWLTQLLVHRNKDLSVCAGLAQGEGKGAKGQARATAGLSRKGAPHSRECQLCSPPCTSCVSPNPVQLHTPLLPPSSKTHTTRLLHLQPRRSEPSCTSQDGVQQAPRDGFRDEQGCLRAYSISQAAVWPYLGQTFPDHPTFSFLDIPTLLDHPNPSHTIPNLQTISKHFSDYPNSSRTFPNVSWP